MRPSDPTGSPRSVTLRSNNNKTSGGFPHSEIHGSKPIPGSPWLNAGYHVLHRLLLPRHPPNALFALDLIQKEQGWFNLSSWVSKAVYLPNTALPEGTAAVSVLDLEQYCPRQAHRTCMARWPRRRPLLGPHQTILMFLSLRCQFAECLSTSASSEDRMIKHRHVLDDTIFSSF
jgi:hypothetical protein